MAIIEKLRGGSLGARFAGPTSWKVLEDGDHARWLDASTSVVWHALFFPHLQLDLDEVHLLSLQRDAARHTRYLFERVLEQQPARGDDGPRTRDPAWSPLLGLERHMIGGAPVVTLLHRMTYQPGSEILMGHLLAPLARGMLELRWVVAERGMTGLRESTLMALAMNRRPGVDPRELMRELDCDDPAHDAAFPAHPLSIARAQGRWLVESGGLAVLDGARHRTGCEIRIALGCALTPPPRFVLLGTEENIATFCRPTFCGTDGVEWLEVRKLRAAPSSESFAAIARDVYRDAEVSEIVVTAMPCSAPGHHVIIVEGQGHLGPLRMGAHALCDAQGSAWALLIATTTAQPRDALAAELESAARSLRPI